MATKSHEKTPALEGKGLTVIVKHNDVEKAIRQLKKKVNAEGIQKDLRRKEYFEKPSVIKRRMKAEALNRWRKKEREILNNL